jgi:hypothetical protein
VKVSELVNVSELSGGEQKVSCPKIRKYGKDTFKGMVIPYTIHGNGPDKLGFSGMVCLWTDNSWVLYSIGIVPFKYYTLFNWGASSVMATKLLVAVVYPVSLQLCSAASP